MNGCEMCTIDWDFYDVEEWNCGSPGEVRIGIGEMYANTGIEWVTTPIKFCPFCGRKFESELNEPSHK